MKLEEIINILRYNDIPIGKLNNVKDLVSNELVEWDIFGNVKIPSLPLPGSLNNQDVPDLGEDTLNILKELEYSENEIEDMIKENIIMPNRGEKKA